MWLGLLTGIAGVIFGILAAILGLIAGLGIGGLSLIITGLFMASSSVPACILAIGTGMFLLAGGIAMIIPLVLYCGQFLPWLINEASKLIKWLIGKKEQ